MGVNVSIVIKKRVKVYFKEVLIFILFAKCLQHPNTGFVPDKWMSLLQNKYNQVVF